MDPNIARQVLRLDPLAPLTVETVEAAFARESWERHPSRYPDAAGREAAAAWAASLAEARVSLLHSIETTDAARPAVFPWAPPTQRVQATNGPTPLAPTGPTASAPAPAGSAAPQGNPRRGGRRVALVLGIVAASAGVLALIGGAAFGATRLAEQVVEGASDFAEDPYWTGETVRYPADETRFTFPAAVEEYYDGRYSGRCPAEYDYGCWEMAIITESSCALLEVDLEFTDDEAAWRGDHQEVLAITEVTAGEPTPVVFGNNDYEWAWLADVRCLDAAAPAEAATR